MSPGECYSLLKTDIDRLAAAAEKRFDNLDIKTDDILKKQHEHDKDMAVMKVKSGFLGILGGIFGALGLKLPSSFL